MAQLDFDEILPDVQYCGGRLRPYRSAKEIVRYMLDQVAYAPDCGYSPSRRRLTDWANVVVLCVSVFAFGCAESNFELAEQSRLPKWFALPPGLTREDVVVRLAYYEIPETGRVVVQLWDKRGKKLREVTGKATVHVRSLGESYPAYQAVTVNGITEVVEHRRMEPFFYISDDPAVRRRLGL